MSKKIKSLVIGSIILILLIGALVFLLLTKKEVPTDNTSSVASTSEAIVLNTRKYADMVSVSVKNSKGEFLIDRAKADDWIINELKKYPQSQDQYTASLEQATAVTATREIEKNPKELAKYGLDKPQAQGVVTYKDKSTFKIKLGKTAGSNSGVYAQIDGKSAVYIVSDTDAAPFLKTKYDFLDLSLTEAIGEEEALPKINSFTVERKDLDKPIQIVYFKEPDQDDALAELTSAYKLKSPFEAQLDAQKCKDYLALFMGMTAQSAVTVNPSQADKKKYGLDKPEMIVTAKYGGKTHTLTVGKGILSAAADEELAGEDYEGTITSYYIMFDNTGIVYTIDKESLSWLTTNVKDIISQNILTPVLDTLSSIVIKYGNKKYTIDITGDFGTGTNEVSSGEEQKEDTISAKINGKQVGKDKFKAFYQFLIKVGIDSFTTSKVTGSPSYSITYNYRDKSMSSDVVEFFPYESRTVAVALNGQASFVTRSAYVERAIENIEKIAQDKEINPNW
ncbi:MAG: hypothetical protein K0R90_181 [Oscillospiraceae bacterium]|jgi:nitrogen regulatory protein PII|nr:hypothetical protein [Oscillospiraceae bacterium]